MEATKARPCKAPSLLQSIFAFPGFGWHSIFSIISFVQCDWNAFSRASHDICPVPLSRPITSVLDPVVLLQESHHFQIVTHRTRLREPNKLPCIRWLTCDCHFHQGKVLPNAYPWSAIERNILPWLRYPVLPSVRAVTRWICKIIRCGWIQILSPLHSKGAIDYDVTRENGNIWLAKLPWKRRVLGCRNSSISTGPSETDEELQRGGSSPGPQTAFS